MRFRGGEFSTGTMGNFQPELTDFLFSLHGALRAMRFAHGKRQLLHGDSLG